MEKRIIVEEISIHQAIIGEEMPIYQRINGEEIPIDLFPAPFPNGMRVLAIDYNVICLRILERMLQKCQYHVTTTTRALTALNILRENKDTFDIIISNVEMPDMDGFELLKIVGLEMDLPVIMLSAYNETKFVMNGVISGACDYLLKPVRLLELKNIWQHVVKKKFGAKDMKNSATLEKTCERTFEGGQGSSSRKIDQNGEFNRKRKDQCDDNNIDDDDDEEEDGQKNEDQAYKKPRVVWSTDLHHKFVVAVNQLGFDKAVPKKILDLMNVDKLSRENVASHLQKYRIYMKKLSYMENHQENMMASLAGQDPSYLHTSAFDGLSGFHALTRMTEIPNALGSYPTNAMLGGLNTPVTFDFNGLSSRIVQHGHASTLTNFVHGHQNENLLNGVPIDQLQNNNSVSHVGDFSTTIDGSSIFTSNSFLNPGTPEAGNDVTSQSWFTTNSSNTLEDLLNAMVKHII